MIDKPSGFHVHPPEINAHKVPRRKIILHQLRDQIGQHVYPVHRLDVSTSGVMVFALSSEAAREICFQFESQRVQKTYWAVVRGHMEPEGVIDLPLESDSSGLLVEARTEFRTLKRIELPFAVGPYPTSRYSWIEAMPRTGRFHQIRRHLNRISHPIVGDAQHGDSRHNRFIREEYGISGLCLRAVSIEFPSLGQQPARLWKCGLNRQWILLQNMFDGKH